MGRMKELAASVAEQDREFERMEDDYYFGHRRYEDEVEQPKNEGEMNVFEISESVTNGTMNALDGYVRLKRIERDLQQAMDAVKDEAIAEADKYGKGEHEAYGAVIQRKAGAGRWDYSHLPWFTNYKMMMKAAEEKAKAAAAAAEKMRPLPVDPETGEVIEPAKYTPGKETVSIRLKS